MDIKSLKDKILQLAMQGKLVAQNVNDEPVRVLLEKIKVEKEGLIKDKIIKKENIFTEISEEEKVFELPKGWEWCRLGQISNYIKAGGDKPKDFSTVKNAEYTIPVIANGKRNKGIVGYTNIATENNVCLTVSGRGTIGYSCIRKEPFCPIVRLIVIYPSASIDISYLNYALQYFIEQGVGTSIQQLTVPMIKPKVIPLPPLEEQKRIVGKVEELFELIEELDNNKQELFENISNTRNKILKLAIQGKLVEQFEDDEPANELLEKIKVGKKELIKNKVIKKEKILPEISEEEKVFDLPKGWEWCRLGQISNYIKAGGDKPKYFSNTKNGEYIIPVIANGKTNKGIVGYTNIATENNVCLTVSGRGTIGYSCIRKEPFCPIVRLIVIYPSTNIDIFYLNCALQYFIEQGVGTSIQQLTVPMINPKVIPLPPLEEQKRIVAKVNLIMGYLDKLQQEIESQEIILEDILK